MHMTMLVMLILRYADTARSDLGAWVVDYSNYRHLIHRDQRSKDIPELANPPRDGCFLSVTKLENSLPLPETLQSALHCVEQVFLFRLPRPRYLHHGHVFEFTLPD